MFDFSDNDAFTSIVGHSPALESVIRTAQIAAATDVHILIEGETGTGKELMAQALQQSSRRADKPFVIINCAALPAELVESLMFGHEKGAFTGANERKDGYVQKASGGTLFLDEIGELPLSLQSKLLRFVENGECQRLGSHEHEVVDVRIIAATNKNLMKLMETGQFRQDLFYRLSVVSLHLPSLKERRNDIAELAKHFLQQAAEKHHSQCCSFSQEALTQLKKYHWPGNIRELKNVCQHVSALLPGELIEKENLPLAILEYQPENNSGYTLPEHGIDMESLEVDLIKQALSYTGGNKSRAARLLGLSRDAFLYRLKKHNL
ncbi:MAG: sigma-54 dependent transcriptional regulator [Gammaproteobacteria bacterium]|nr:sigma-54 dependent transcriptional regulator [Gammaproteobacteria bacterium]MBT8133843.1 sigma-54 dependent transcriptional regulator [Gammaproteobacteria bacterium]NNJ51179.1 sigma-54-dependent Fis family transcriptional regulator [Gammaproteobacteria bacterium]